MNEKVKIKPYIDGYYIPNISKLTEAVASVLGVTAPVHIKPMGVKTSNAIAYVTADKNNEFSIFIDTNILRKDEVSDDVIKLFIHELTHVHQMQYGSLKNVSDTCVRWQGVHYSVATPLDKKPWEVEASAAEEKYFDKVKKALNN